MPTSRDRHDKKRKIRSTTEPKRGVRQPQRHKRRERERERESERVSERETAREKMRPTKTQKPMNLGGPEVK